MNDIIKWIIIYLVAVNLITFALFVIDKYKARRRKWRIREATLLIFSVLGGCVGGLLSMQLFRHKTQTPAFKFGMPLILIVHIVLCFIAFRYM